MEVFVQWLSPSIIDSAAKCSFLLIVTPLFFSLLQEEEGEEKLGADLATGMCVCKLASLPSTKQEGTGAAAANFS